MLRNGIKVCIAPNGDFVVPVAQPLRPLVHNMLWEGEDAGALFHHCYDISFYSYPIMRGFSCLATDCIDERLIECKEPIIPGYVPELPSGTWCVRGDTTGSVLLANMLVKGGYRVERERKTGNFVLDEDARAFAARFAETHCVRFAQPDETSERISIGIVPRILTVADSGAVNELLCELGYDAEFLPFSELNCGYRIDTDKYDVLVVGGTAGFWNDTSDDLLGNTYQVSWGLRERGRRELIRAAGTMPRRILYGFAGAMVNEAIGGITCTQTLSAGAADKESTNVTDNWRLSVPNGTFNMVLDPSDPLCLGYDAQEVFYLVAPISYSTAEGVAPIAFRDEDCFRNGFNKRKGEYDGQFAAIHRCRDGLHTVLLGFDPTFRKYTDKTYRILTNAIYAVCE